MPHTHDLTAVTEQLQQLYGDRIRLNEPLGRYTTFKIGGPADIFFEAKTTAELLGILEFAIREHIPYTMLGGGTNVLIGDKGIRGLVIRNCTKAIRIKGIKGKLEAGVSKGQVFVEVDSGVLMNQLVRFTIEEGLAGLEMHLGLPGTVGGALYMNSKWMHPEGYVGDAVYQATIVTPEGEVKDVPRSYFRFAYDYSILQKTGDNVISVVFALTHAEPAVLWEVANRSIEYRRQTQPQGVFSPGCTFRNVSKAEAMTVPTPNHTTSAGYLVDHAGLKGQQVGEIQVSPVHANFLVNKGKGTAADVLKLIATAKQQVKTRFGVELHEEIVHLGEF